MFFRSPIEEWSTFPREFLCEIFQYGTDTNFPEPHWIILPITKAKVSNEVLILIKLFPLLHTVFMIVNLLL